MKSSMRIGVIGGTGNLGAAIAWRLAKAGYQVIIGSRSADSAREKATSLGSGVQGAGNAEAAAASDVVFVCVPFAAQSATLAEIAPHVSGKLVVDTTVPLMPPKVMRVQLPSEGSAAVRAQSLLGTQVRLVSALHNVAAHKLATDQKIDCHVLVFGDDKDARSEVIELVAAMDLRGIHGGALTNSAAAEALTSVLILINKTYTVDGAGIQITGIAS
jgi:8-hydroxy-5-deazaflavin:NADPH oxidoreductase